jgi:transposase
MPNQRRRDPKTEALRERGTLNPKPDRVLDRLFRGSEFFDARDLLQVKYEMIRRVEIEGAPIAQAAEAFGFSRPSFYEAQAAFSDGGLPALLPKKRGPRTAHKLGPEVMAFIDELRAGDTGVASPNVVQLVKERFGLIVHPRSIERALARLGKKQP